MSDPTVSVVLPTYDRSNVLERAVESVLAQEYTDFELLVVDGGPAGGAGDVVASFDDERVRYVRSDDDGPAEARNHGIRLATGSYVAFQDSDDRWDPAKLRNQMRVFESAPSDVGVVYTAFRREFPDGTVQRVPRPSEVGRVEGDLRAQLLALNVVTTSAAVVRAECLEAVGGFDEALPTMEDWDLWLRIATRYEFRFVDEPLVEMATLTDSLSRDQTKVGQGLGRLLAKHHDAFFENDPRRLAALYWRLAEIGVKAGHPRLALRALARSATVRWRALAPAVRSES